MRRIKYPKTHYLPYSPGKASGDHFMPTTHELEQARQVVVTEKMDGENTTIYRDGWHVRSINSIPCQYHSFLQSCILPPFQYKIPEDWRVCGEYLYVEHTIHYSQLQSYFEVFSIWNKDVCLSWEMTKALAKQWGLVTVPELYIGKYNEKQIAQIGADVVDAGGEGIVVRVANEFPFWNFAQCIGKYVRQNHVPTKVHWRNKRLVTNEVIKHG